jgi:hypothetical protein
MDRQNALGHPMIVFPMTPVAESIPTTVSTETGQAFWAPLPLSRSVQR